MILPIFIALSCFVTSCSGEDDAGVVSERGVEIFLNDEENSTNENVQTFSLKFYQKVSEQKLQIQDGNFVVSPLSAAMAMALVANLCDDDIVEQILKAYDLTANDLPRLSSLMSRMCKEMPGVVSSVSKLNFANSLWIDNKYKYNNDDALSVANMFDAKVATIDLNSQDGANEINSWVSDITNGAISALYQYVPSANNCAFLANALYFEAPWAKPFDKGKTKAKTFYNEDGSTTKVDMMKGSQDVSYYEDDEVQCVSFAYEKTSLLFRVIMPKNGLTVASFVKNLTIDDLSTLYKASQGGTIEVTIPKIDIESEIDAASVFSAMGIKSIFSSGGAFENFLAYDVYIAKSTQKNLFSLSEEKTKVASATSAEFAVLGLSGAQVDIKDLGEIVIDHPFLYEVFDLRTNTIIAMGQVTKL